MSNFLKQTKSSPKLGRSARPGHRRGVTIIEVLFAIGIVIVGLLGVASLLPLAARNAELSNEANEGQAYAQRYYAEFVSRGFNNSANWRWFDDSNKTMSTAYNPAVNVASTGGAGGNVSTANRHAICIDPGFYADPLTLLEVNDSTYVFDNTQAYRPGLFPYYHDTFDPTSNPTSPAGLTSPPALQNRPRLLRVGLHDPDSGLNLLPAKVVQSLFMSLDDLAMNKPQDKSLPPAREAEFIDYPIRTVPARGAVQANYSWLATLCPREFGIGEAASARLEEYYTLSVVVMRRRERAWFQPTGITANEIPQGERLLGLTPLSGNFTGGDGGRVMVTASTGIDDTIRTGDWVMLSRYQNDNQNDTPPNFNRGIVCRWYRVIGVDADATFSGGSPPTLWTRNLVLEGPDWVFDPSLPTQATLVSNVVTVFERVIPVE